MALSLCLSLFCVPSEGAPTTTSPAAIANDPSCRACHPASTQNVPGVIMLDMLKAEPGGNWFGPVRFNHAGHAGMAGSCNLCHHRTPAGQPHPECRSCHEPDLAREDISKPSLKGAYHRQCMGCHREWSHGDRCQMCHLPKDGAPLATRPFYMAHEHPPVAEPVTQVYETEHKPGLKSAVVFRHKDHIERYGNSCVDCHRSDNCMRCHDSATGQAAAVIAVPPGVSVTAVRSTLGSVVQVKKPHPTTLAVNEEHHQSCIACHSMTDEARCGRCHIEGVPNVGPFDHATTGFPLAPYHEQRSCRDCHKQAPFGALDSNCSSCHAGAALAASGSRSLLAMGSPHPHEAWYGFIKKTGADNLCVTCHRDFDTGAHAGMHPVGPTSRPVPDTLIKAGAQVKNSVAPQKPGAELGCLTCHSTATVKFAPIVLADSGPDGLCLACHPQQNKIFGTVHDIRSDANPGARLGPAAVAGSGGTCRTCHPAHGRARAPAPTKGDPAGQCTACHQSHGWAQSKLASAFPHPETACTECHNPHESRFGHFLSKPLGALCIDCHAEQGRITGGPHDPSRHPEAWPDRKAADRGVCLACHVPHSNEATGLLRFPIPQGQLSADGACLACHPKTAVDSKSEIAILHPLEIRPGQSKIDAKLLFVDASGRQRMECRTCHDPHAGGKPENLTRGGEEHPASLCLGCHKEKQFMKYTGHSAENLLRAGFDTAGCRPCHAMHGRRDQSWGQMLSSRFLTGMQNGAAAPADKSAPLMGDAAMCGACHHAGGHAPAPSVAAHPAAAMHNASLPGSVGYLPLFDAAGHENINGQVTCRTCHLSHGRLDLVQAAAESKTASENDRRAMRLNVRPFVEPNVCTECHGEQARVRFLIFHDVARRAKLPRASTVQSP